MRKKEIAAYTTDIASATRSIHSVVPRALDDVAQFVGEGAKEVAVLTVVARQQAFELAPVMEALQKLSKVTDWSHKFLVAHDLKPNPRNWTSFDWRDSPWRKYESFEDFYRQELEQVWGRWADLQATYAKVVSGEITEPDARRIILRGHGGDRRSKEVKVDQGDNSGDVVTLKERGNSRAYTLARLDRADADDLALKGMTAEQFTNLAAKVRAKTMSANAAAIDAGFRKKPVRKKLTKVERVLKSIAELSKPERRAIWRKLDDEFG
jgi:hypothetical protein